MQMPTSALKWASKMVSNSTVYRLSHPISQGLFLRLRNPDTPLVHPIAR